MWRWLNLHRSTWVRSVMKLEISCFFADINDFCKILDFRIFSYGRGQKLTPEKPATGRRFRAFLQFFMGYFQWLFENCIFSTLTGPFSAVSTRNFENKTIWLANSTRSNRIWKKINWFFFDFSSKFSRIISQRNRHGSGRALAHFFVGVCRWDLPIFSSIGDYGGESVCNRYNRKI